jgi:hypothetical protein
MQPAAVSAVGADKISLYNTNRYAVFGFFFGIFPIAMMSLANAKVLPEAAAISKRMRGMLIAYAAVVVAHIAVFVIAVRMSAKAIVSSLTNDPRLLLGSADTLAKRASGATTFVQNSGLIFFVLNIGLLIATVISANRTELPAYQVLDKAGRVTKRAPYLLLIIGAIIAWGIPQVENLLMPLILKTI